MSYPNYPTRSAIRFSLSEDSYRITLSKCDNKTLVAQLLKLKSEQMTIK